MQGLWVWSLVRKLRSHMPCGVVKKKKEIILTGFCPSSFFILEFVDTFFVLSTLFRSRLVRFLCQDLLAVGAASLLVLVSEEDTLLSPTAPWGVPVFSEVALGLQSLTCHTDSSTHTLGVQRTSQRVPIWKSRQWFVLLPIPKLSGALPPGLAWGQRAAACQRH